MLNFVRLLTLVQKIHEINCKKNFEIYLTKKCKLIRNTTLKERGREGERQRDRERERVRNRKTEIQVFGKLY